jgi:hypothetical protein
MWSKTIKHGAESAGIYRISWTQFISEVFEAVYGRIGV